MRAQLGTSRESRATKPVSSRRTPTLSSIDWLTRRSKQNELTAAIHTPAKSVRWTHRASSRDSRQLVNSGNIAALNVVAKGGKGVFTDADSNRDRVDPETWSRRTWPGSRNGGFQLEVDWDDDVATSPPNIPGGTSERTEPSSASRGGGYDIIQAFTWPLSRSGSEETMFGQVPRTSKGLERAARKR